MAPGFDPSRLLATAVFWGAMAAGWSPVVQAQAQGNSAYVTDTRGEVVRNATYLCWHTGYWTPAAAVAECDPDLVPKPAALTAPAAVPPPVKPAPAPVVVPALPPAPVMQKVSLSAETLFDFDKSIIKPQGRRGLDELAAKVAAIDLEVIIVSGHTDSIGADAYNQRLSLRRAEAVKRYLVGKGIPATRITAEGKGEKQPVASNRTRDGRAKNRRVEIEVIGNGR